MVAPSLRAFIFFSTSLQLTLGGSGAAVNLAKVRVANYVSPTKEIDVMLQNSSDPYHQLHFTVWTGGLFSAFESVNLTEENGPGSYFKVDANLTAFHNSTTHQLSELVFFDSSAPYNTEYSLSIYGNCTATAGPQLWINVTSQKFLPRELGIDQALVELWNTYSHPVYYSNRSDNCYHCLDYFLGVLYPGGVGYITVSTTFPLTLLFNISEDELTTDSNDIADIYRSNMTTICSTHFHYSEHSKYLITLNGSVSCSPVAVSGDTGDNAYLPLLYVSAAIAGVAVIWILGVLFCRLLMRRGYLHYLHMKIVKRNDGNLQLAEGAEGAEKPKKIRLKSLDAFRGFSLTAMIFVSAGGGGYWFFDHSKWNGLTVADLVFPWFVWIMGVSIVFSFKGRRKDSFLARLYQVVRRSLILFGLGLCLKNEGHSSQLRIPGVLQRFAISYFVVALTELLTAELYSRRKFAIWEPIQDITNNWVQWVVVLVLEFLWLMLTFLLPLPDGCPRGYLGPGGLGEMGCYQNCTGGAALVIDKWLFHSDHLYRHPTAQELYQTGRFDPSGALGSLNSIVICFLGVQAGKILVHHRGHTGILVRLAAWGTVLGVLGTVLCEGQKNEGIIPINKNLWSLSFILVMAGTGFLLLALFYLLVDVMHWWNGSPFSYPGMNSIIVYVGSELLKGYFPFSWQGQYDSHLKLLVANIISVSIWLVISYYFYCIGFFVKI